MTARPASFIVNDSGALAAAGASAGALVSAGTWAGAFAGAGASTAGSVAAGADAGMMARAAVSASFIIEASTGGVAAGTPVAAPPGTFRCWPMTMTFGSPTVSRLAS